MKNIEEAKRLWEQLEDIPTDNSGEFIDKPFLDFPKGTDTSDIWHWFEDEFNLSIAEDL